uniref:C-type lectin domain-containing protein n=1 Tax=Gouania willdenowi TaxID=441366 RepID=A0A8C5EGW2_GOUWI
MKNQNLISIKYNHSVRILLSKTLMIVSTGVCFSTGWSYSTCLQYHYVADQKTWTEAQTYCRQTYADLATIENKEQNDQLLDTITSAGQSSEVWMGLYSTIDWRWSDGFSGVGANYRNWGHGHPNFHSAAEFCVLVINVWYDVLCSDKARFVCYNGENMKNQIFISIKYNHISKRFTISGNSPIHTPIGLSCHARH